jgi:hypothetical protein
MATERSYIMSESRPRCKFVPLHCMTKPILTSIAFLAISTLNRS